MRYLDAYIFTASKEIQYADAVTDEVVTVENYVNDPDTHIDHYAKENGDVIVCKAVFASREAYDAARGNMPFNRVARSFRRIMGTRINASATCH